MTQMVVGRFTRIIRNARRTKKHYCKSDVCFQMHKNGFRPEVFKYLSENLPLSKKTT